MSLYGVLSITPTFIRFSLFLFVFVMTIGYSTISQNLFLEGTANIKNETSFDTSKVEKFNAMFQNVKHLKKLDAIQIVYLRIIYLRADSPSLLMN